MSGALTDPAHASAPDLPAPPTPPAAATARTAATPPVRNPWLAGLRAARGNLAPGLVLSAFAAGLVVAYFTLPPVRHALDRVGQWKLAGGFLFSVLSTGLFGGTLPWLINRLRPVRGATLRPPVTHLLFLTAVWGYKGIEVDGFYRFQAWLWGGAEGWFIVVAKVLLDLGVWCAVWAVPTTALSYAFMEGGFTRPGLQRWFRGGPARVVRDKLLPLIVSNFLVWAPACAAIYCMPLALQVPIQNLVLCFWSLVLVLQVRDGAGEGEPAASRGSPVRRGSP